jgi:hypothetical protein
VGSDEAAPFQYDVCLSFAGEQRAYVEAVAGALRAEGIRVFYDRYEQAALWGKNLYEHLDRIYQQDARFCVVFASQEYAEKIWTNHELRSAQARALRENIEYILPARFDDTEIPGIRATIGYIDLRVFSPLALAQLIVAKVRPPEPGVALPVFSGSDWLLYREKIRICLDALTLMLAETRFGSGPLPASVELDLCLTDADFHAAHDGGWARGFAAGGARLSAVTGRFTVELDIPLPRIDGRGLALFEQALGDNLKVIRERGRTVGAQPLMIGILPTLDQSEVTVDALANDTRIRLLNREILAFRRGEAFDINIDGDERLVAKFDTIAPVVAGNGLRIRYSVSPEEFAGHWNAAQATAGVVVALGANSPLLFGRQLWWETRIPLLEQCSDPRIDEAKVQGTRPRFWFGERWITSVFDLFEENVRYFPALLPVPDIEDPVAVLDAGAMPHLAELRHQNGTVYRWNRPLYDVVDDVAYLTLECRVLPAGPTPVDVAANVAFHLGLVRALAEADRPVWTQMSFNAAEENFYAGARDGIDAMLFWPGLGTVPVIELVLRRLLPLAHEGLARWGVAPGIRDRLLGVIEGRCAAGQNGASWQLSVRGGGADPLRLTRRYDAHARENTPVHRWPVQ